MKIPVIIINWNGYEDTIECLDSVLSTTGVEIAIYLVDNGSSNQEGRKLVDRFKHEPSIFVRQLPENIGFAKANNLILEEVVRDSYPFVALLNNDTVVDPSWLEAMVGLAKFRKLGMVSTKLINYFNRQEIDNLGHQMLNTGEIVPIAHKAATDDYTMSVMNLGPCAGAALYSVEMLKEIGFFDPFFSTGYEDAELGLRGIVAGYQSALAPNALIYHKMGQSVSKVFDDQYAIMIQSAIWYTYFKLVPAGVILISLPFILVKNILLSLVNIFFLRWKYLKIQWRAIWVTVTKNRKLIIQSRRKFYSSVKTISTWQILGKQRFFLWFDIIRFYHIFIQKKKSALDQYGGE